MGEVRLYIYSSHNAYDFQKLKEKYINNNNNNKIHRPKQGVVSIN